MQLTLIDQVQKYINENPYTNVEEIAKECKTTKKIVREYIRRLKNKGVLNEKTDPNNKTYYICEDLDMDEARPMSKKNEIYMRLIDKYLELLENTHGVDEAIRIGRELRLLAEKV
ncbi:MAG: hypothetical protein Q4B52_03720 [Tissierellia bacterium]|nr:hypothetical protein [Tissierellia bacterium]